MLDLIFITNVSVSKIQFTRVNAEELPEYYCDSKNHDSSLCFKCLQEYITQNNIKIDKLQIRVQKIVLGTFVSYLSTDYQHANTMSNKMIEDTLLNENKQRSVIEVANFVLSNRKINMYI